MWSRLTWERFELATKYLVAMAWASCELAFWGARPAALGFIGTTLLATEGGRALAKVRSAVAESREAET